MFRTNQPVTSAAFFDREKELDRLLSLASDLLVGAPSWLAILGPRKIGKTSLIHECARRIRGKSVVIVSIDATEDAPLSIEFFRRYALRALDRVFAAELGASLEALALTPEAYRATLSGSSRFARLHPDVRRIALALPDAPIDPAMVRQCLELPDRVAAELDLAMLIAVDEFQDLGDIEGKRGSIEPFRMMRSAWQLHKHTAYIISGSGRTMLERLVTSKSSPFFQHFDLMRIGPLPREAAMELLIESAPKGRSIPRPLAKAAIDLIGTRPFYLQMLGDAITRTEPPYDKSTLKAVTQDLLFSPTGRLSLYFENELDRLVGRSTYLASALEALADGPIRLSDLARAIGAPAGQARGYVDRLGDAVQKRPDGAYELDDMTFGLWLRWRRPGGSVVPMTVLGDHAERAVAQHLARSGFELIYQSRASRGAFDLLATRGSEQMGVQVKLTELPARFARAEWSRMAADAARFGWRWVVAAVSADHRVSLLDPKRARRGATITLTSSAVIDNIVTWIDGPLPRAPKRAVKKR